MKRTLLAVFSLLAAATLGQAAPKAAATPAAPGAAPAPAPAPVPAAADKKADAAPTGKPFPYVGKVTKVDAAAKTFSLNGKSGDRVFVIDDSTKITKDGKPATLADLSVGEEVRGQVMKAGETQTAKSVLIGAKPKPAAKTADASATPAAKAPGKTGDATAPKKP
jgi:pyruvate dehydrogenase E2 component (dihydrolipoamide acetyltransferase)